MIQTYLDLSARHVSQQTMARLSNPHSVFEGWPAMAIAPHQHGVFITVPGSATPDQWMALPTELLNLIKFAFRFGCTVIRLDIAAPELAELPTFEW